MCYTAFTCRLCIYCSTNTQFVDHYTVLLFKNRMTVHVLFLVLKCLTLEIDIQVIQM